MESNISKTKETGDDNGASIEQEKTEQVAESVVEAPGVYHERFQ